MVIRRGDRVHKKLLSLILAAVGVVVLVLGVASGTVFKPDSKVTLSTPAMDDSAYVTVSPQVLSLVNPEVSVTASAPGGGEVALIIGRTVDINGWIGSSSRFEVTGAKDWETMTVSKVAAEAEESGSESPDSAEQESADSQNADSPAEGEIADDSDSAAVTTESDMWIDRVTGTSSVSMDIKNVPDGFSLMAVSASGDAQSAPQLSFGWEREVGTPLMIPGIVLGLVLVLAGAALYLRGPAALKASVKSSGKPQAAVGVPSLTSGVLADGAGLAERPAVKRVLGRKPKVVPGSQAPTIPDDPARFSAQGALAEQPVAPAAQSTGSYASAASAASAASTAGYGQADAPAHNIPAAVQGAVQQHLSQAQFNAQASHDENLDTGALQQLGLTRRQLREMRAARAGSIAPVPQNVVPTEAAPEQAPVFEAAPLDVAPAPSTNSRTTATNWRAAWGVRSTPENESAHLRPGQYNHPVEDIPQPGQQFEDASALSAHFSEQLAPQQTAAPTPALGSLNSAMDAPARGSEDVRQPASWWDTPEAPAASVQQSHYSDGAVPPAPSLAVGGRRSAGSPQESASVRSRSQQGNAAPQPPAHQEQAAQAKRASSSNAVGGTRRALYSAYRAEAERLSAEEDWPVPAPPKADDSYNSSGDAQ